MHKNFQRVLFDNNFMKAHVRIEDQCLKEKIIVTMIFSLIFLIYFKNLIKNDEYDLTSVASHRLMMNLITILIIILIITRAYILSRYEYNMMKHRKKQQ